MTIDISDKERSVLLELLRSACNTLDTIMQDTPTREVADNANALEDILVKLGEPTNEGE